MTDFGTEGNPAFYDATPQDRSLTEPSQRLAILGDPRRRDGFSLWDWVAVFWGVFWDGIVCGALFRRDKQRKP